MHLTCLFCVTTLPMQVTPKGRKLLARVAELEEKTTGGILLPTSSQKRPTSGDVVTLGDGRNFTLKEGETILYNKFGLGATDVLVQGELHIIIAEDDVIGVMPRSGATADDIPDLRPIGDRVLLKVDEEGDVTSGGVILSAGSKEKPVSGTVVRVGPGKWDEEKGERKALRVKEGDKVVYFKYAGDTMETSSGEAYIVLHESDLLSKL
jgi:chaperonin GroES